MPSLLMVLVLPLNRYKKLFELIMNIKYEVASQIQFRLVLYFNDQMQGSSRLSRSRKEYYDEQAIDQTKLKWSLPSTTVLSTGGSEFNSLVNIQNVVSKLRSEYTSEIEPNLHHLVRQNFNKRFLIIEGEVEGLLKRKINCSVKDTHGNQRLLDYTLLLNEKENQVVQLHKKIQNIQEKLRRSTAREIELENYIVRLHQDLKGKEELIRAKSDIAVAEVAISTVFRDAIFKIRKNFQNYKSIIGVYEKNLFEGVIIPDVGSFEVRPDNLAQSHQTSRMRVFNQQNDNQKHRLRLVQFFREFQRLVSQSQGIVDFEIERLIQSFLINMNETKLYQKMQTSIDRYRSIQDYARLKENFAIAAALYNDQIEKIKKQNPAVRIPNEHNIFEILQKEKVKAFHVESGAIFIQSFSQKTVEIPVQDARAKHLLHLFAMELKKLFLKYPKLQQQMDERLIQFFQQEIIDCMEVDEIDKIVSIVKYVPQIVKVQNVYAFSNEKSRKVQFHLRILIKALLEELEKIRVKSGLILDIDEGVIGMIKSEIMSVVNVDDILKTFRSVPKIVEVEKIVEKIVERIVEVPKVQIVQKIIQKVVQVEKIRQVERFINVPLETPIVVRQEIDKIVPIENTIEKIIEVPTIVERIVQLVREVEKVVQVEKYIERIVEVEKVVEVERIVNHIQIQYQTVEVIVEKLIPVQKVIERIVEVPIYVEKIIEKIVEVPQIVEIQKIVEKIVPQIQYRSARQVQNHIEVQYNIIERIVQKPVIIIQVKERIIEVPQLIQVMTPVRTIQTEIKEIEVVREKIVVQEIIKEIEKVKTEIVAVEKEVIKEVQRIIQIPFYKEVIVSHTIIVEKPMIERIQTFHTKQVFLRDPIIVKEPKIVEVEKFVNVYVDVPKIVKYYEERIIQVPTIVDRIKEVRVQIDKIIEKMVEVPKVVEVEKIVQKIVVVPRVIQKVIEVPQIVQKIVEKEVIREVIRIVQKVVQVPAIQQKVKEVEVKKNVFFEVEKLVDRIVEKMVEVPRYEEKVIIQQVIKERIVQILREVPKQIYVDKIVHQFVEVPVTIEVERQIIVPIEIAVPVDRVIERVVVLENVVERLVQVPQIIEKPVPVIQEIIQIHQIERIVERVIIEQKIKEIQKIVPYYNQIIKEVPTIVERIVPIQSKVQEIITAQQIVQKIVQKTITIPKIYQVESLREKLVEIPKIVEIQKLVPQIIRVNQYIQKIVEKIVEVPIIIEKMKQIIREQEKVVSITNHTQQIVEVERIVEKLVFVDKIQQLVRSINHIEQVLKVVDRYQQIPVPITTIHEKFIEIPVILEKIVEKIVIMPQIVEVLKYVHEVCESQEIGVALEGQAATHELKFKQLSKNLKIQLDSVSRQLRSLKGDGSSRGKIEAIEKLLYQLDQFILFPRIIKVIEEKRVEVEIPVDHIVEIPIQDERAIRMELSLSVLVEKLILQMKRISISYPAVKFDLDQDISLIFFSELNSQGNLNTEMQAKLKSYSNQVHRQFQNLGQWSIDHQFMLNSFLQERFLMAELIQSANFQIEQSKALSEKRLEGMKKYKEDSQVYNKWLNDIQRIIEKKGEASQIIRVLSQFERYSQGEPFEATSILGDVAIDNERMQSLLRQRQQQNYRLRDRLLQSQQSNKNMSPSSISSYESINRQLKSQIVNLRQENNLLLSKTSETGLIDSYRKQIQELQSINLELERKQSDLQSKVYNLENQLKVGLQGISNISFKKDTNSAANLLDSSSIQQSRTQNLDPRTQNVDTSRGVHINYSQVTPNVPPNQPQPQYYQPNQYNQSSQSNQNQGILGSFNNYANLQKSVSGSVISQIPADRRVEEQSQRIVGTANQSTGRYEFGISESSNLNKPQSRSFINASSSGLNLTQSRGNREQNLSRSNIYPVVQDSTQRVLPAETSSIFRTPIDNYKGFNSPSPTAVKMTQSIYREESGLSRISAQSPHSNIKEDQEQSQSRNQPQELSQSRNQSQEQGQGLGQYQYYFHGSQQKKDKKEGQ